MNVKNEWVTGNCECCAYEDLPVKQYQNNRLAPQKIEMMTLCRVCAYSMAAVAYQYPEQHPEFPVLRHISWTTNHILQALK